MSHSTDIYMGSTRSSVKVVESFKGALEAGLAVRLKSDGTLSTAKADGELLGISLGVDQSDTNYTAVVRKGLRVPILLTTSFSPTVGAQVNISDTTGKAIASGQGATAVNAKYVTGALKCVKEDGTVVNAGAALIDFEGGL